MGEGAGTGFPRRRPNKRLINYTGKHFQTFFLSGIIWAGFYIFWPAESGSGTRFSILAFND